MNKLSLSIGLFAMALSSCISDSDGPVSHNQPEVGANEITGNLGTSYIGTWRSVGAELDEDFGENYYTWLEFSESGFEMSECSNADISCVSGTDPGTYVLDGQWLSVQNDLDGYHNYYKLSVSGSQMRLYEGAEFEGQGSTIVGVWHVYSEPNYTIRYEFLANGVLNFYLDGELSESNIRWSSTGDIITITNDDETFQNYYIIENGIFRVWDVEPHIVFQKM